MRAPFHHHQHDDEMMPCLFHKNIFFFLAAGLHFSFLKKAGHHQKGAGRRALQRRPRQDRLALASLSFVLSPLNKLFWCRCTVLYYNQFICSDGLLNTIFFNTSYLFVSLAGIVRGFCSDYLEKFLDHS